MLTFKNEDAHAVVEKNLGAAGHQELSGLDFLPFPDLEKAVEDDVKYLKASNAIPDSITVSVGTLFGANLPALVSSHGVLALKKPR